MLAVVPLLQYRQDKLVKIPVTLTFMFRRAFLCLPKAFEVKFNFGNMEETAHKVFSLSANM